MLWFCAMGIALVKVPAMYFSGNCTATTYFSQLQTYTVTAQSSVCSSSCQCYFTSAAQAMYTGTMATQLLAYAPNMTSTDPTQAVDAQACVNQGWNTAPVTGGASVMAYLEPLLSCSEWCNMTTSPLVFYKFSNVNNGIPMYYCYSIIQNYVNGYSMTGYIVAFVMTGIVALAFLCGLWLRCEVINEGALPQGYNKNEGPSMTRLQNY